MAAPATIVSAPPRRGNGRGCGVEDAGTVCTVRFIKGEDGVNWCRRVLFWPSFDWFKTPHEAFLAIRE
jgi:hypothetical protein